MSTKFLERRTDYCKGCPLEGTPNRSKHIPTEIVKLTDEPGIEVLFIGEAPGENEAVECRPFIGKSGKYVRNVINKYANANYAIGNAARCRPTDEDGNNRAPTPEERAHCIRYTLDHIHKLKPKKIVCLGGVATGAFIDGFRSVASIRGQEIAWKSPKGFETVILPTYHPAARDMYQLSFVPKDIKKAFKKRGEKDRKWDDPGKEVVLDDLHKIKKLLKHIHEDLPDNAIVAVDVETLNGVNRIDNRCISIAFSWDGVKGYSFPLDHPKAPWTPKELKTLKKWLRRLFTKSPSFRFWEGHNSKFEIQQLHTYLGIWARNRPWLDTMLEAFLNDENRLTMKKQMSPFSLKQLSAEKLGLPYEDEVVLAARERGELWKLPWKKVCKYNAEDAWKTRRLHDREREDAGDYWDTILKISEHIYSPALFMFARAEKSGFRIDIDHLYELQSPNSPLIKAMKEIDETFRKDEDVIAVNKKLANRESGGLKPLFGVPWVFSPDKKAHLIELFVKRLKLEPLKYSEKTEEPSLDTAYYENYASESILAKKMAERQEIKKLLTSYLDQIRNFLENDPECEDGRVRPQFRLDTVVTGRTSCQEPNLQQIPKGESSDYAKATKNLFTVDPGNVLISGDLKQGEVILMAQTTGDKLFAKAIWRMQKIADEYWVNPSPELKLILDTECDTHRQSAAILYGVDVKDVTKEQRNHAKAIVTFGIIYGKHIKTIAQDLGVTEKEAQKIQDKFFAKFLQSKKGLLALEKMAMSYGFVESTIGRRRRLPQALSPNQGEANRALRQARNSPIQSLLSDYTLFQAGRLNEYILNHGLNWRIVDVVHDAILTEVPFADAKRYVKVARRIMTDTAAFEKAFSIKMIVPMLVDFDAGISYGNLSGVESWCKGDKSLKMALKKAKKAWKEKGYDVENPEAEAEEETRKAA